MLVDLLLCGNSRRGWVGQLPMSVALGPPIVLRDLRDLAGLVEDAVQLDVLVELHGDRRLRLFLLAHALSVQRMMWRS
jgi:hypothetical protein